MGTYHTKNGLSSEMKRGTFEKEKVHLLQSKRTLSKVQGPPIRQLSEVRDIFYDKGEGVLIRQKIEHSPKVKWALLGYLEKAKL